MDNSIVWAICVEFDKYLLFTRMEILLAIKEDSSIRIIATFANEKRLSKEEFSAKRVQKRSVFFLTYVQSINSKMTPPLKNYLGSNFIKG